MDRNVTPRAAAPAPRAATLTNPRTAQLTIVTHALTDRTFCSKGKAMGAGVDYLHGDDSTPIHRHRAP
jgi:hypothetical protein